jgi:signal transduction histidine kinase
VDADEGRLVQVLCNLLSNSAKYMREGGRIDLTAGEEAETAVVAVIDEGVGIPREMLASVFERYVQVGTSGHRADGGLGIGLSLVKALIEEHGGTVAAFSEGIGHGSRFEVRLPTAAGSPAA